MSCNVELNVIERDVMYRSAVEFAAMQCRLHVLCNHVSHVCHVCNAGHVFRVCNLCNVMHVICSARNIFDVCNVAMHVVYAIDETDKT